MVLPSTLVVSNVQAQCPVGSFCFFGTDANGTAGSRATNVQSQSAHDNFFLQLVGVGTEDFEGFAAGTSNPLLNFVGAGTAQLSGGGQVRSQGSGTDGNGRYPVSGTNYYEATSASGGGATFTIDFASPVAAFGFFGVDIGDFGSQLSLVFTLVGGGTASWQLPYVANSIRDGSLLYAGFINETGFTSVAFDGTSSADVFAFDDMTIGNLQQVIIPTSTPEPGTMALAVTGLLGLAGIARRRRKA
jgi:MYXO-CTERM domain-containing protein